MKRSSTLVRRAASYPKRKTQIVTTKWGLYGEVPVDCLYRMELSKLIHNASTSVHEDLIEFARKYPHQFLTPRQANVVLLNSNEFLMDRYAELLVTHHKLRPLVPHELFCLTNQHTFLDEDLGFQRNMQLVSLHIAHQKEGMFGKESVCCRVRWEGDMRISDFVPLKGGWMAGVWFAFEKQAVEIQTAAQ